MKYRVYYGPPGTTFSAALIMEFSNLKFATVFALKQMRLGNQVLFSPVKCKYCVVKHGD